PPTRRAAGALPRAGDEPRRASRQHSPPATDSRGLGWGMRPTEQLRRQHLEQQQLAEQISRRLDAESLATDAEPVRRLVSALAGNLKIHLAMEDASLYPRLLGHHDERVRAKARRFLDERGGPRD